MSTKARYENGLLRYYESTTHETVKVMAPLWRKNDFDTPALDTTNLITLRDTAEGAEIIEADGANGAVSLALTATSEAQLAGFDYADQRPYVLNQGLNFEARIKLSVLPTSGTIMVIGLCGDHNATADTIAENIWFRVDGSGAIKCESDDTATDTDDVATGVTVTNADWVVLRIDCTVATDIKFYINGNRVASGTTFTHATGGLKLQPVARLNKASGTSVGTMLVDYIAVWSKRS